MNLHPCMTFETEEENLKTLSFQCWIKINCKKNIKHIYGFIYYFDEVVAGAANEYANVVEVTPSSKFLD